MSAAGTLNTDIDGYQVRTADRSEAIGEIEGVMAHGVRLHKLTGHAGHAGYLPSEAIARVDKDTDTVYLVHGVEMSTILDAPAPPNDAWRTSPEWWADLLGHYGMFDAEGKGNEPMLHPDQR